MPEIKNKPILFTDDSIVDTEKTTTRKKFEKPIKRDIAFRHDAPWEASDTVYHNIVKLPGGGYRMYYKSHYNGLKTDGSFATIRRICYIESKDGLHWERPVADVITIPESPENNIISFEGYYFDNLFVFYDENPDCPKEEKFKAIYGEWNNGLYGYTSEDGIHFDFSPEKTLDLGRSKDTGCYYDTLNIAFYDKNIGKYVAFVRGFHVGDETYPPDPDIPEAVRDIRRTESDDFRTWSKPELVKYNDDYDYQLYASAVLPYYRNNEIYISTPTRYIARGDWSDGFEQLCGAEARKERGRGQSLNDTIFMSSQDTGKSWVRSSEAIFTSGPERENGWVYGDCYPCVGMIETPALTPDSDPEISMFMKEHDKDGVSTLYRYTMRIDGFAAYTGDFAGKVLVTKPFKFEGSELIINFATSAQGGVKFTLTDSEGNSAETCEYFGDKIDRRVKFDRPLSDFEGKEVTLSITLKDASIYSFRFA